MYRHAWPRVLPPLPGAHWHWQRHIPKTTPLLVKSSWRPLLLPAVTADRTSTNRGFFTSHSPHTSNNPKPPTTNPSKESRWSDVVVLLSLVSAIVLPTKKTSCEDSKTVKAPILDMKSSPSPTSKVDSNKDKHNSKGTKDDSGEQDSEGPSKINLLGPLPPLPIPKIPTITMDDIMAKVQGLGEKISEEIKGRVPTLADYFTAVDVIRTELQLGDGSLYQTIISNMKDTSKNPEIQLDATVRQGNDLCAQEVAYQSARRKKMKKAFAKFIGVHESDINENDIPIVAIAGSGGGYRAMISSLGYMTAAKKAGLFDCTMYMAGVSGSCWMIAQYMTLGQRSFAKTLDHFKRSLSTPVAHYPSFIDTMLTNPGAAQLILEGIVQKYCKGRVITLVDAFGTVLGSRLLIHRDLDDHDEEWVDPLDFKMSQQSRWTNYGDQPLPIYTVVSHVLPSTKPPIPVTDNVILDDNVGKEAEEEDEFNYYQWFEMTPYEFGSEETSAWVPTWAFGRRFVEGKSVERIPETNLAILMGTFGSAFTATLSDYYNEVRPLLHSSLVESMDSYIEEYLEGMSRIHPLSPSCFPNPIYKLPDPEPEAEMFSHQKNIYLNDAGMDNNLPLYPLLRPGRNVDVILAFDSSADIETVPWFEKTDEYVKRRGVERWPPVSTTRAKQIEEQEGPREMTHVEVFHGVVSNDRDADLVNSDKSGAHKKPDSALGPGSDVHPITLIYYPLIPNDDYSADFNPATEIFCSTFNFEIKEDQVELLAGLGEKNFSNGLEDVRRILKETWLRKKKLRLEREKQEKRARKN